MTDTFRTPTLPSGFSLDNRFTVADVLGIGGFAITYRAFDATLERYVAIKEHFTPGSWRDHSTLQVHTTDIAGHRSTTEQFVREGRAIARCSHPSIVKVHQVFEANNTAYLVMELLSGPTLEDRVKSTGPLALQPASELLNQIGGALQVIHANGLVHQDVSPSNVMLTEHEQRAVLIDFGAARNQVAQLSRDLTRIVKPGFSPIEQYGGSPMRDASADVYALGATGYYALTAQIPAEATLRFQTDQLIPATQLNNTIPPTMSAALHQAMSVDPLQRPTVAQFLSMVTTQPRSQSAFPQTVLVSQNSQQRGLTPAGAGPWTQAPNSMPDTKHQRPDHTRVAVALGVLVAALLGAVAALSLRQQPGTNERATDVTLETAPLSGKGNTDNTSVTTVSANPASDDGAAAAQAPPNPPLAQSEATVDVTVAPLTIREPVETTAPVGAVPTAIRSTVIGTSTSGRSIELIETGTGANRVLVIGGLPGDFSAGPSIARKVAGLVSAGSLNRSVTLSAIPDPNPDGRINDRRENGRGVDLNRNFPSDNFQPSSTHGSGPLSEPETRAVADAVLAFQPRLVIALIGTTNGAFVNYDGSGAPYARIFSDATGFPVKSSGSITPTPGSLGSWIGVDNNLPMLTIAYNRQSSSSTAWLNTQAGFHSVLSSL